MIQDPPAAFYDIPLDDGALRKSIGVRADQETQGFLFHDGYKQCLRAFVHAMTTNQAVPSLIWDLHRENNRYLLGDNMRHRSIVVTERELNRSPWFEIEYQTEKDSRCWWRLLVLRPATAVFLMRDPSITDRITAVNCLASRGIPFRTIFEPERGASLHLLQPSQVTLGYRDYGATFNRWDYSSYEGAIRTLLSTPRARGFLLKGGLLWRLAMEYAPRNLLEEVTQGPSPDVWYYGATYTPPRGPILYGDHPTASELDLMCGVYKVYTSK